MKRISMLLAILVCALAISASASITETVNLVLPYPVMVSDHLIPAGDYTIQLLYSNTDRPAVKIQSKNLAFFVLTQNREAVALETDTGGVVLVKKNDVFRMTKIIVGGQAYVLK